MQLRLMKQVHWVTVLIVGVLLWSPSVVAGATAPRHASLTGTLVFAEAGGGDPNLAQIEDNNYKLFEKAHPGVTIKHVLLPADSYDQKLALLTASGQEPDVFFNPQDAYHWVKDGHVLPLDNLVKHDPILGNPKKTHMSYLSMTEFDGKHWYYLPQGSTFQLVLFFNRAIFDQAHMSYPNNNWTYNDLLRAARKLTKRDASGKATQWGFDLGYLNGPWDGGWETIASAYGAKKFVDNWSLPHWWHVQQPAVVKAWQYMHDLVYKYKVAPDPDTDKAFSTASGSAFATGKVAMVADATWDLASYVQAKVKVGISLMPKGPAGRPATGMWPAGGPSISSTTKKKALAWEFIRWLTLDRTANKNLVQFGTCGPAYVKAFNSLYLSPWKSVYGSKNCITAGKTAKLMGMLSPDYKQVWSKVINDQWTKFLHNQISAEQLAALQPQINQTLGGSGS